MKKHTRSVGLILAIALAVLTACETAAPVEEGTTTATPETTTVSAETESTSVSRENTPDSLPELNFKNASVRIAFRGDEVTAEREMVGDDEGDVVADAVYQRNRMVEERLGVVLDLQAGNANHGTFMEEIRTIILAGDDVYDIVDTIQWLSIPHANEGLYRNLYDAPYIDYNQPWWNTEYMDTISIAESSRPLLAGDISTWLTSQMSCMYVNKRMYTDVIGDPDQLYQTVLDGEWTYDLLLRDIAAVYRDLNADGLTDAKDILGLSVGPDLVADHYCYTAGFRLTERNADNVPTLLRDQSWNVSVMEKLYDLFFTTTGVLYYGDSKYCRDHFINGQMLYYGQLLSLTDLLRDMEDPYGMIPFPKLNEEQADYVTLVHDASTLFAIPQTVKKLDIPCAVLEALCAENYRTVTPAYYEVALKSKYAQDEYSSQMIDLIHSNSSTEFLYANNYILSADVKMGTIARTLLGYRGVDPSRNYMSAYDSIKASAEADIAKLADSVTEK